MLEKTNVVKKKVVWLTPDYFVDCDLNREVLDTICLRFDVHWIVLLPISGSRYNALEFKDLMSVKGLTVEFFYLSYRGRDPRMLYVYMQLWKRIKQLNGDLVYFNDTPTNPYAMPLYFGLRSTNTIFSAHDGRITPEFKWATISKLVFWATYRRMRHVVSFSTSQQKILLDRFPRINGFHIPLGLKSFGASSVNKRSDTVSFLFFGSVQPNKNLALLIDAACSLYKKGARNFKIVICGQCDNWECYASRILYPEIFEYEIRFFSNNEIANLFAKNHYAVFPYRSMSQSGALKVAFNYHLPVIVSDLSSFTSEVQEGVNGFIFRSENLEDLERVMKERIQNHSEDYLSLQNAIKLNNSLVFSPMSIATRYAKMFDQVLSSVTL